MELAQDRPITAPMAVPAVDQTSPDDAAPDDAS
jgi:hypothetical protein